MWRELGLDLEAHDTLLQGLGTAYQDVIAGRDKRPQALAYLDFVMSEVHGLRIRELLDAKASGRKVIGAFCVFVPEEIVLAADAVLVGLCTGADFAMEEVEKILPRNTCSLIKSAFGFKLSRVCPFLEAADMVVGENTCDGKKKSYEMLQKLIPNLYVMDLPQQKSVAGRQLLAHEFRRFFEVVEELAGVKITAERLRRGIELSNNKRAALARLAHLRAAKPVPISGLDALLINQVAFYDDPQRFTDAVNKLCDELEERIRLQKGAFPAAAPRILLSGCPMAVPNWKVYELIERSGAVVVGEESCVGERGWRNFTKTDGTTVDELLEAVVDRYFQVDCAVFTPNLERDQHIREMSQKYHADGVIHYSLQFCQPYIIESMSMEQRLQEQGYNFLRIETDYSREDYGQLQTRIEAFIEIIS
jgi:benzoyl-CoA reductase/2-hydroxyglutaryl-CoA dehydratase subunit BcrC/BadD/HgdB